MKRKIKKRNVLLILAIIIVIVFFIFKINSSKNIIIGTWKSDGGTIYEFKKNNHGVMKTFLSQYKFKYKIKDNILSIDFEDEKAIDTDYEYSCEKKKCIFKSDRGTFTFTKK